MIGDFEFELHRPLHCKVRFDGKSTVNLQSVILLDKLPGLVVEEKSEDSQNHETSLKEEIFDDESFNDESFDDIIEMDNLPDELAASLVEDKPKPKKRRQKPIVKLKTKSKPDKIENKSNPRPSKLYQCTQEGCTEEFRQQRYLRDHLRKSHGIIERVHCTICNFGFTDKSNLKHHMILHTDEKRFICSFCGARFHKLTNMNEHMNAHLGLKPYKCEICDKSFGRANHKRQHLRVNKF